MLLPCEYAGKRNRNVALTGKIVSGVNTVRNTGQSVCTRRQTQQQQLLSPSNIHTTTNNSATNTDDVVSDSTNNVATDSSSCGNNSTSNSEGSGSIASISSGNTDDMSLPGSDLDGSSIDNDVSNNTLPTFQNILAIDLADTIDLPMPRHNNDNILLEEDNVRESPSLVPAAAVDNSASTQVIPESSVPLAYNVNFDDDDDSIIQAVTQLVVAKGQHKMASTDDNNDNDDV